MTTPCPHCQNPAPADSAHAPYCCHGCLLAHRFITEAGLGRYYDLRQGPGAPARDRDAGEHEIPAFVDALLSDARDAVDSTVVSLWADGRLPEGMALW